MQRDRPLPGELEQLRKETIASFDRMLTALILAVKIPQVVPAQETAHGDFFIRLMTDVFENDERLHVRSEGMGWKTINGFHRHCNTVQPGWASRQTFYDRMNACLQYLLAQGIIEKRPAPKRHGKGRAEYEYRINPDHPYVRSLKSRNGN
jgi:hypothetical protein